MSDPVPRRVVRALDARDGRVCAWHGAEGNRSWNCRPETLVPQHRQRGSGGRVELHRLSNLVWLCSALNGAIEADADLGGLARAFGISIALNADPEAERIKHAVHGLVLLGDDGGVERLPVKRWPDGGVG